MCFQGINKLLRVNKEFLIFLREYATISLSFVIARWSNWLRCCFLGAELEVRILHGLFYYDVDGSGIKYDSFHT